MDVVGDSLEAIDIDWHIFRSTLETKKRAFFHRAFLHHKNRCGRRASQCINSHHLRADWPCWGWAKLGEPQKLGTALTGESRWVLPIFIYFSSIFWKVLLGNVVPPSFHHRTDGPWPSNFAGGWRSLARSSSHGHGGSSSLCGLVLPS